MAKKATSKSETKESPPPKPESLLETALKLSELMKQYPQNIEKPLIQKGENVVGVFSDPNFSTRGFADLKKQKAEIIQQALEDIASGVLILRTSMIGLQFLNNKILNFVTPHGNSPDGQVVYSVNWKDVAAFKNWRNGEGDDVSQDSINSAIYSLAAELSRLI
jgi:hypothetical protein